MYPIKLNWGINIRLKLYFAVFLRLLHNISPFATFAFLSHMFFHQISFTVHLVIVQNFFSLFQKLAAKISWPNLNMTRLDYIYRPAKSLTPPTRRRRRKNDCKYKQCLLLGPTFLVAWRWRCCHKINFYRYCYYTEEASASRQLNIQTMKNQPID